MSKVREIYRPVAMGANTSYVVGGAKIGGFLPTVSGTLTVTDADGSTLLNAYPITAGTAVPLGMWFNTSEGGTVTLAGGAAGTLLV